MPGGDGEGATEFHDYEGGGIGEGEGTKDVSDKIENEDQVGPGVHLIQSFSYLQHGSYELNIDPSVF